MKKDKTININQTKHEGSQLKGCQYFTLLPFILKTIVILLILFILFLKLYTFEKKEGAICIHHHNNTESLNLSYIPDEECTGYKFRSHENVLYTNDFRTPVKGRLQVLLGKNFPGWLSNKKIRLTEHKFAYALPTRYAERKLQHLLGKDFPAWRDKKIDLNEPKWVIKYHDRLGNYGYEYKPWATSRILGEDIEGVVFERVFSKTKYKQRHVISEDNKPAFKALCSFYTNGRQACTISFPLNATIEVSVGIMYDELNNIKSKINKLKSFLNNLIISDE